MSPLKDLSMEERKILQFFHEHPQAVETVRGIATWLGAEIPLVQEALKGLVERKWLLADQTSVVVGFTLTCDDRLLLQLREALGIS